MVTSLKQAVDIAEKFFAAESAAVEVEIAMVFGPIWIGRDLVAYDHPRFGENS